MNYIKYLLKNKTRLLFVIFLNLFTIGILTHLIINYDYVVEESSEFVFKLFVVLLLAIFFVGNYQPYKEWNDGNKR